MGEQSETTKSENPNAEQWKDMEPTNKPEAQEAEELELDLDSAEWDESFASAETFIKTGRVVAVQITEEGLKNGEYADRDIRWSERLQSFIVDTHVMENNENSDGTTTRESSAETEDRVVEPGFWLLTNPTQQEGDALNNYAQSDETFRKAYEPDEHADQPNVYRAKGYARIFRNPTGKPVFIHKWGGIQKGNKNCYFCERHMDGKISRYLLSENDFAAYEPYEITEDTPESEEV